MACASLACTILGTGSGGMSMSSTFIAAASCAVSRTMRTMTSALRGSIRNFQVICRVSTASGNCAIQPAYLDHSRVRTLGAATQRTPAASMAAASSSTRGLSAALLFAEMQRHIARELHFAIGEQLAAEIRHGAEHPREAENLRQQLVLDHAVLHRKRLLQIQVAQRVQRLLPNRWPWWR